MIDGNQLDLDDISDMTKKAKNSLAAHENNELVLPARKKIMLAMGESKVNGKNQAIITPGLVRRTRLETLATEHVWFVWKDSLEGLGPLDMLSTATEYLQGKIDWNTAWSRQNSFSAALDNIDTFPDGYLFVSYVGHAAVGCVLTALKDYDFEDGDMLDEMMDSWDTSFYACGAYAGELPWDRQSDPDRRFEFWNWWLDVAVPQAASEKIQ